MGYNNSTMNIDKREIWVLIMVVVCIVTASGILGWGLNNERWQKICIEKGIAQYNPTNANFEFKQ